jgi:hypothetical protein
VPFRSTIYAVTDLLTTHRLCPCGCALASAAP